MKIQSTNEPKNSVKSQILLQNFYTDRRMYDIFFPLFGSENILKLLKVDSNKEENCINTE